MLILHETNTYNGTSLTRSETRGKLKKIYSVSLFNSQTENTKHFLIVIQLTASVVQRKSHEVRC